MTIATIGMTSSEMALRLERYRSKHTIEPVPSFSGEVECAVDGVRVFLKRGNVGRSPWRHDPDEIKALAEGVQR